MMGTAGELPKAPEKKTLFVEDMNDSELAEALKLPVGLTNLGNTCYMNSTLQCLRVIPELQTALNEYSAGITTMDTHSNLTASMRDLYQQMSKTADGFPPMIFLQILRTAFPQFAEQDRTHGGYMQQDAEECWAQIVNILRAKLKASNGESFVDQWMGGTMTSKTQCKEAPEEEAVINTEKFIKLDCHISINVNYMHNGIMEALSEEIEKQSPSLGRQAIYTKESRISRLPHYLTVHFVRFYWRRDIGKKTKIMRKVKFPFELDATAYCTDELRAKLLPVRDRVREIEKEKEEKKRAAKKQKVDNGDENGTSSEAMAIDSGSTSYAGEIAKLVDPELKNDVGSNVSGLYDLVSILTHKGASADSGHYIGWSKGEKGDEWYKFNDDEVSIVPESKIGMLDGGGEDSAAYILLYRAKNVD